MPFFDEEHLHLKTRYTADQLRLLGLMCPFLKGQTYREGVWPYAFAGAWFFRNEVPAGSIGQYSPGVVRAPEIDQALFSAMEWLWNVSRCMRETKQGSFASPELLSANQAAVAISAILWEILFSSEFNGSQIGVTFGEFFHQNSDNNARTAFLGKARRNDTELYQMIFNIRSRDCVRLADGELPDGLLLRRKRFASIQKIRGLELST